MVRGQTANCWVPMDLQSIKIHWIMLWFRLWHFTLLLTKQVGFTKTDSPTERKMIEFLEKAGIKGFDVTICRSTLESDILNKFLPGSCKWSSLTSTVIRYLCISPEGFEELSVKGHNFEKVEQPLPIVEMEINVRRKVMTGCILNTQRHLNWSKQQWWIFQQVCHRMKIHWHPLPCLINRSTWWLQGSVKRGFWKRLWSSWDSLEWGNWLSSGDRFDWIGEKISSQDLLNFSHKSQKQKKRKLWKRWAPSLQRERERMISWVMYQTKLCCTSSVRVWLSLTSSLSLRRTRDSMSSAKIQVSTDLSAFNSCRVWVTHQPSQIFRSIGNSFEKNSVQQTSKSSF